MKLPADLRAAEEFLREKIPLTRVMGVRVVASQEGFAVEAPVEPNHNHLQTAFGGSINAVATLAGYTLLWLELRERTADLVVRESAIRFIRPVRETIRAVCAPVAHEKFAAFTDALTRTGKAQIRVSVRVEENGEIAAEFRGTFVALTKHVEAEQL